jgi:hypothetical protein
MDDEGPVEVVEGSVEDLVRRIVDLHVEAGDFAAAFGVAMKGEAAINELLAELYPPPGSDRREPPED